MIATSARYLVLGTLALVLAMTGCQPLESPLPESVGPLSSASPVSEPSGGGASAGPARPSGPSAAEVRATAAKKAAAKKAAAKKAAVKKAAAKKAAKKAAAKKAAKKAAAKKAAAAKAEKARLRPGPAIMQSGSTGDQVRALQARLKQIGWFSASISGTYGPVTATAVRGFQGRRAIPVTGAVDQRTWNRLTAMTREPTYNEKHNVVPKPSAKGLDRRCLTGRALCISKSNNSLVWVINGKPQARMDVRFGSAELPTREGAFSVGWKSRNHVSTLYHTKMPYAMFFSGGQAVHYSPDFAARGYNGASHGCVNVRNLAGIQSLFAQVRVGDKVIVYR